MTQTIRMMSLGAATALLVMAAGIGPAAAKGDCVKAGGTATIMPNNDVATFMAEAALKNSIAAQGRTKVGPTKVVCDGAALVPTCTATAKACK
jgi:hypothetical protein